MEAVTSHLAHVVVTFLVAGMVKGVTGLGLPTVSVGLLGLVMPPPLAAGLIVVPSFVTNLWQGVAGGSTLSLLARLWPMLAAIVAGVVLGAAWFPAAGAGATTLALGVALIAYAASGLLPLHPVTMRWRTERWLAPGAGLATGLVTAGTGVFVMPSVPFLQALGLPRDALVQALGLVFTVATVALAAALARDGTLGGELALASFLALAPAMVGMAFGQWLRPRVSAVLFRRCFFATLLLLGAHLAVTGLRRLA